MRHLVVVASLMLVPGAAIAQTPGPRTQEQLLPIEMDGYHMLAIAAGVAVGAVVANALTSGLITPIGAVVGGYVGDWIYRY